MKTHRSGWLRLAAVWIAAALLLATGATWAAEPAFRFAVIGDSRIGPLPDRSNEAEQPEMFFRTIEEINLLDYDLAFDVGDLIVGYTEDAARIERMWDKFDEAWRRFRIPAKMVAGNHDIWDEQSSAIYVRRYGGTYYSFDIRGCHFIVLCTEDVPDHMNYIRANQLQWLKRDLEANQDAAHVFVLMHKPLWTYDDSRSNWKTDVHPLLVEHGVDAVFAGHVHIYREYGPTDGVRYFVTGGAGAPLSGDEARGGFFHHMAVSVRGDEVRYAVVRTGSVLPTEVVSDRSVAAIEAIRLGVALAAPYLRSLGQPVRIQVSARNERSTTLHGSLAWSVPPHWTVEPQSAALDLAPGETARLWFTVSVNDAAVFPLPEARIVCSWGVGPAWHESIPLVPANDWFVRDWMVIGPFDLGTQKERSDVVPPGFAQAYPPEREVDFAKRYQGVAGEVAWKRVTAAENGYVDLRAAVSPPDHVVAYATATVTASRAIDTVLALGSNDGAKVWVNGKQVYAKHIGRGAKPHQEKIPISLRQGANQILIKVENWGGQWGLYAAIVDLEGVLASGRP